MKKEYGSNSVSIIVGLIVVLVAFACVVAVLFLNPFAELMWKGSSVTFVAVWVAFAVGVLGAFLVGKYWERYRNEKKHK
jgi:uncharacterized membrane protein YbhN (UPF0104 family)